MTALRFVIALGVVLARTEASLVGHSHVLPGYTTFNSFPVGKSFQTTVFNYPSTIHAVAPAVVPAFPAVAPALPSPTFPFHGVHPIVHGYHPLTVAHGVHTATPAFPAHGVHAIAPAVAPVLPGFPGLSPGFRAFAPAHAPIVPKFPSVHAVGPAVLPTYANAYDVAPHSNHINVFNKFVGAVPPTVVRTFAPTVW